jgi:hypothetical protein
LGDQKKKTERYSQEMKVHMSHYHNSSCSSVWLSEREFFEYFESAVFCDVLDYDLVKSNLTNVVVVNRRVYLTLKIKEKCERSTFYISFINEKDGKQWPASKCMGWSMMGAQKQNIEKVSC